MANNPLDEVSSWGSNKVSINLPRSIRWITILASSSIWRLMTPSFLANKSPSWRTSPRLTSTVVWTVVHSQTKHGRWWGQGHGFYFLHTLHSLISLKTFQLWQLRKSNEDASQSSRPSSLSSIIKYSIIKDCAMIPFNWGAQQCDIYQTGSIKVDSYSN